MSLIRPTVGKRFSANVAENIDDALLTRSCRCCYRHHDVITEKIGPKRGSIANTSLSTATCEIHEIHMILGKPNVLISMKILYIPIAKAQRHHQSVSALQCQKHANCKLRFNKLCSVKFCKICKNLQKIPKKVTRRARHASDVEMPQNSSADALKLPSEMSFVGFWC